MKLSPVNETGINGFPESVFVCMCEAARRQETIA
jgi:hypothetical protein